MTDTPTPEDQGEAFIIPPPERSPKSKKSAPQAWQPRLGPIGTEVLLFRKQPPTLTVKLLYGERGSLKTGIACHDLILHCHSDVGPQGGPVTIAPLAVICTITRSTATEGGAWEKLNSLYLPEWFDGIGLDFTEPRQDDQKNRYIFISNQYGGWSRVVLKSIPHGENLRSRLKGIEPSYIFFDELTEADNADYFVVPTQQLRRPTGGPRIFLGACNPHWQGEENWVWKQMVANACKDKDGALVEPDIPEGGGRIRNTRDDYAIYHVPISENVYWSKEEKDAYQKTLLAEAHNDPSAIDRLIHGRWVSRPTGEGLFKNFYIPTLHKIGDAVKRTGLKPQPGIPITIGYDIGPMWPSITFEQLIPTKTRPVWIAFDEVDYHRERVLYKKIAWEVIDKIIFWNKRCNAKFRCMHIADSSAVNQWRAGGEGSFDSWDFEREFNRVVEQMEWTTEDKRQNSMRMIGCDKGAGSVESRVRLLQTKLYTEEFYSSATCLNVLGMLSELEADKDNPGKPKKGKWIHKFDSLTYPMFFTELRGGAKMFLQPTDMTPNVIQCGIA